MRRLVILFLLGLGLCAGRLATAHHSFAAVFDGEKNVTLTGEVVSVEWTNPHFHFSIDVKDAGGAVTRWRFEGLSTQHARAAGLAARRDADGRERR